MVIEKKTWSRDVAMAIYYDNDDDFDDFDDDGEDMEDDDEDGEF